VRDLRRLIASNGHLPIDNLSLILRGTALCDLKNGDDVRMQLNDGGIVLILIVLFDIDNDVTVSFSYKRGLLHLL